MKDDQVKMLIPYLNLCLQSGSKFKETEEMIQLLDTWIKDYDRKQFLGDLPAGITVGIMLIPQGMAYAMIAGLPEVYGLYAALFPQIIYAFLGTSRQLAVGPVAMDSLLVAAGLSVIATVGTEYYILLAISLALMVGIIQFLMGLFKLGFLVNFLSKPVISGFTSAAAIIIAMSQLKEIVIRYSTIILTASKDKLISKI